MIILETKKDTPNNPFRTTITKNNSIHKMVDSNISLNIISVTVLPPNAHWFDMEGFVDRRYGPFSFIFKNENGDIVAAIDFSVAYNCQGKFNSSGHYLADVTIAPRSIFANPGYFFACNVTSSNPINFGTKSDPIAYIALKIQMQVKSFNKLLLPLTSYSLNTPVISENLSTSTDPFKEIESADSKASSMASTVDKTIFNDYSNNPITSSNADMESHCSNKLNVEEQFLSVGIRGDGSVYIINGYGY